MIKQKKYEFRYNSSSNAIEINTLLSSQFHFVAALNELQRELFPEEKILIKIEAFDEGSFTVKLLLETGFLETLFSRENIDVIALILASFANVVVVYKFLAGKKADKTEEKGNKIEITLKGEKIEIEKDAFNIYQNNQIVNKSIRKNFELLECDEDIDGIEIIDKESTSKLLKIESKDFNKLTKPNEYLDKSIKEDITEETLFIKKPDHYPKKFARWGFIHKGKTINVSVLDEDFIKLINEGEKFGQGDSLTVDLKTIQLFDERFQTYIDDKYEILYVKKINRRSKQEKLF